MTHAPGLMKIGPLALIVPDTSIALTPRQWSDVSCAVTWEADGQEGPARALLAQLEARLGVRPAHRLAIEDGVGAVAKGIREAKRRAALARSEMASRGAATQRDPEFERPIDEKREAAHAKRAEAASLKIIGSRQHRKAIKDLERDAAKLEREAEELRDLELAQDRMTGEARAAIIQAKARGEGVTTEEREQAMFVLGRYGERIRQGGGPNKGLPRLRYERVKRVTIVERGHGLQLAFEVGWLDSPIRGERMPSGEALFATGKLYRDAYELVSAMGTAKGDGGGGFGPKAPQVKFREAGEMLAIMRAGQERRYVEILDQVCGEGRKISEIATSRGRRPALQRRLRHALTAAMINWADPLAKRRVAEVGQDTAAVNRALEMML